MPLVMRGKHWYGDTQSDIRAELLRYSQRSGYPVHHFADATCGCGSRSFHLLLDDAAGAAVRLCTACGSEHPIGDSAEYLAGAELHECECPCGRNAFEITVGVSLYEGSADVRWLYIGCRCPGCGLTACYGDWKNEYNGYTELLRQV